MALKLTQIIALEQSIKSRVYSQISELNKLIQKRDLFNGFVKSYAKKDDDGEDLPPERKRVQMNVDDTLETLSKSMTQLFNITAKRDWTNTEAKASVVIDGKVLVRDAPVPYLLFLEKQLTDIRTFVGNLPTLDEAEYWAKDNNIGIFRSELTKTHRTKKMQKPIILYPHSAEHPAQTQLITEDIIVGFWEQVKLSGAMPSPQQKEMLARVETLLLAVKSAREEANSADEVMTGDIGGNIFRYVLGSPSTQPSSESQPES